MTSTFKIIAKTLSFMLLFFGVITLIPGCVSVNLPASNSSIRDMSVQEFESAVKVIKVGDSQESVRNLLGSPTRVHSDHRGNTSWEYDDTQVSVFGVGLFSRNDRYKFAIIIFDESKRVLKTNLNVR